MVRNRTLEGPFRLQPTERSSLKQGKLRYATNIIGPPAFERPVAERDWASWLDHCCLLKTGRRIDIRAPVIVIGPWLPTLPVPNRGPEGASPT